jgi:tRNA nucleotidyltransferase (CCA-adding enzyme)
MKTPVGSRQKAEGLDPWNEIITCDPNIDHETWNNLVTLLQPSSEEGDLLEKGYHQVQAALLESNNPALKNHTTEKTGSYGKGTWLPLRQEIDIVVIIPAFEPGQMKNYLSMLSSCIKDHLGISKIYSSPHAIQFKITIEKTEIDVDLLPCGGLPEPISFLDPDADSKYVSASASVLQRNFIR